MTAAATVQEIYPPGSGPFDEFGIDIDAKLVDINARLSAIDVGRQQIDETYKAWARRELEAVDAEIKSVLDELQGDDDSAA